jgi:hypothetical protein
MAAVAQRSRSRTGGLAACNWSSMKGTGRGLDMLKVYQTPFVFDRLLNPAYVAHASIANAR